MQPLIARTSKIHGIAPQFSDCRRSTNAREILALPEVGGALVCGATLESIDVEAIVSALPPDV